MGRIAAVTARKLRRDETEVARAVDDEVDGKSVLIRNVWKESDPMRGGKQIRQAATNHNGTVENIFGEQGSF